VGEADGGLALSETVTVASDGVTEFDGAEGGLVPPALVAVTVKVGDPPLRFGTVHLR
jgi:hypothetical protein